MKPYELAYLISPNLSAEEAKALGQKIGETITKEGGTIERIIEPSKKRLSYAIEKQVEAYFGVFNFSFNQENVAAFKRNLKDNSDILRHLLINYNLAKARAKSDLAKKSRRTLDYSAKPEEKISGPQKVELKELDKKIEEILGEQNESQ